jgi:hypothetical protein
LPPLPIARCNREQKYTLMNINPSYLEISFDKVGVRDSQKRLKEMIGELVVEPLKAYQDELLYQFPLVQAIVEKRVAAVISYWTLNKSKPAKPSADSTMSQITNASKNSMTVEEFYKDQVKDSLYSLAPILALELPDTIIVGTDELEYALIEIEEKFDSMQSRQAAPVEEADEDILVPSLDVQEAKEEAPVEVEAPRFAMPETKKEESRSYNYSPAPEKKKEEAVTVDTKPEFAAFATVAQVTQEAELVEADSDEKSIVISGSKNAVQKQQEQEVVVNVLNLMAEQAWKQVYNLIGWNTEYIQGQMLPRWQQDPGSYERDRRFLYQIFMDTIRNAAGMSTVAGHYTFADKPLTVDQLWNYYYTDLSRNVGGILTQARLQAAVNDPWWKKAFQNAIAELRKISVVWLIVLTIAMIFDALTTYVSLDQTPMEGMLVIVFTVMLTILFQIADMMVISYRKREFEAEALEAKYKAMFERFSKTLDGLSPTSESFVQLSMERSQAVADWKAAEDSKKMSQRGRFWSARFADINVIITAYGFAYMLLNGTEPMYALYTQIDVIRNGLWAGLNLWVFLMIGMAITVSFVINTAQRTEILGWSMRRLKDAG